MAEQQTTETLRATLFDTLEKVRTDEIDASRANAIVKIADKILQSAKLEIDYAESLSRLDKDNTGVNPGPMLLANKKDE